MIHITTKDGVEKCIKAIGQSLIEKAEDIAKDIKGVSSITIFAEINPQEVINFDVTKNYYAALDDGKEV